MAALWLKIYVQHVCVRVAAAPRHPFARSNVCQLRQRPTSRSGGDSERRTAAATAHALSILAHLINTRIYGSCPSAIVSFWKQPGPDTEPRASGGGRGRAASAAEEGATAKGCENAFCSMGALARARGAAGLTSRQLVLLQDALLLC